MPIRKKKIGVPRGVSDDSFRIAKSDNKIKLFGKFNNRWYAVPMQDAFEVTNQNEAIKGSILTFNGRNKGRLVPNITASHDGALTFKKKGSDNVQLKNVGTILKLRNAADDGDADFQCAHIRDINGKKNIEVESVANAVSHLKVANTGTASSTSHVRLQAASTETYAHISVLPYRQGDIVLQTQASADGTLHGTVKIKDVDNNIAMTISANATNFILQNPAADFTKYDMDDNITKIWTSSLSNDNDIDLNARRNLYLSGGTIYFNTTGTVDATYGLGTSFGTFANTGNTLVHTNTSTSTGLIIDSNLSGDSASDGTGLSIDFDRTVAGSGTANHIDRGINLDVTSASLGNTTIYGMDIDVIGATSGTSTAIGIDVDADGADTNIGLLINTAGTHIWMQANADAVSDYGTIAVADTGDMTITTVGNGTTDSDLTLDVDGDIIMDAAGGDINITSCDVNIAATKALYFDGGSDTYIRQALADSLRFTVGGADLLTLTETTTNHILTSCNFYIPATKILAFDGGGDTYITETSADSLQIVVGNDVMMQLTESGADGNHATFRADTSVGFTRKEAAFGISGVIGGGGYDTDIDFRFSNKFRLEMIDDITNMNLIFPQSSCNCVLVCTTNGDHDVTNWKVYEQDESVATTTDVMWAGGAVPAFTNSGVDIVSFYWDADEQQAYGVASLAFATP